MQALVGRGIATEIDLDDDVTGALLGLVDAVRSILAGRSVSGFQQRSATRRDAVRATRPGEVVHQF